MAAKRNRYPGVQPFRPDERHIFFGRDEDIENLYDLILLEKIVVLFGKSGYGKSSLLSAGVLPRLGDESQPTAFRYQTIELRFGNYVEGSSLALLEKVQRIVAPDLPGFKNLTGLTLWQLFKQRQATPRTQFLLVFDQFEELFSYPAEQQREFRWQLAELLFAGIPQAVRETLDTLPEAERLQLVQPMNVKAVFSIRSDRMSLLDSMKDALPTILHRRYELRPLSREQAQDAIVKPALLPSPAGEGSGVRFDTPPFEYSAEALRAMLDALSSTHEKREATPTGSGGIEAFLLQILCEHVEGLVKKGGVPDLDGNGLPDITPAQLPDMNNLLEGYVHRKLDDLGTELRPVACRLLEEGLLAEDPTTGEGRRTSVDGKTLLGQFRQQKLTQGLLDALEKTYLVRREPNTVGGVSYEISHDRLVGPVMKMKAERLIKETKSKVKRRIQRLTALYLVTFAFTIGATFFGLWAFDQKKQAEKSKLELESALKVVEQRRIEADSAKTEAETAKADALRQKDNADNKTKVAEAATTEAKRQKDAANHNLAEMKKAQTARDKAEGEKLKAEVRKWINEAIVYERAGEYPHAIAMLKAVLGRDSTNSEAIRRLKKLEEENK